MFLFKAQSIAHTIHIHNYVCTQYEQQSVTVIFFRPVSVLQCFKKIDINILCVKMWCPYLEYTHSLQWNNGCKYRSHFSSLWLLFCHIVTTFMTISLFFFCTGLEYLCIISSISKKESELEHLMRFALFYLRKKTVLWHTDALHLAFNLLVGSAVLWAVKSMVNSVLTFWSLLKFYFSETLPQL